jgi:hypothetical protein
MLWKIKSVENNFIYSERCEGKTEFITRLANDLYRNGGYKIDFYSMTSESLPNLERGISYDIYTNNIVNKKYIIDLKKEKIKAGKLDILFIDDIHFLDNWNDVLSLECDKFISVDILDERISSGFEKVLNGISYNLFHLSEIEYNTFSKPYLRDKKINKILS